MTMVVGDVQEMIKMAQRAEIAHFGHGSTVDLSKRKTWSIKDVELPSLLDQYTMNEIKNSLMPHSKKITATYAPRQHTTITPSHHHRSQHHSIHHTITSYYHIILASHHHTITEPYHTITADIIHVNDLCLYSFYKMLIYEPGDFFIPHVDSQYTTNQFGTLSISLPYPHTGGELVIGEKTIDFSSDTEKSQAPPDCLRYAAWHSDVLHHIKPVTSGYRIVLVYLLHRQSKVKHVHHVGPALQLGKIISRLARTDWQGSPQPAGLAIMLHSMYSQRSIQNSDDGAWEPLLSGKDAVIYQAIRQLQLPCTIQFVVELEKRDLYEDLSGINEYQLDGCWVASKLEDKSRLLSSKVLFIRTVKRQGMFERERVDSEELLSHQCYGNGDCGNGQYNGNASFHETHSQMQSITTGTLLCQVSKQIVAEKKSPIDDSPPAWKHLVPAKQHLQRCIQILAAQLFWVCHTT